MERFKPVELARYTAGMATNAGRAALHQLAGGAWGELGERYGEAMGGQKQRPASITVYSTGERAELDIPDNISVGTEQPSLSVNI